MLQLQFGWSDLIQKDNKGEALGLLFDPKDYYEVTKTPSATATMPSR